MDVYKLKSEKKELEKLIAETSKGMTIENKEAIRQCRIYRENLLIIEGQLEQCERAIRKLKKDSRIGAKFSRRTFENWDADKFPNAYEICLRYAKNFETASKDGMGLILTGNAGTGKTHLASAISNYLMDDLIPVKFGTFADLLDSLKESFHTDKTQKIVKALGEVPLLVIDDLGKEKYTDWSSQVLFQVIDKRYNKELPTIITTNLSMEELRRRIGDPIMSRLIETSYGIVMEGENYRYAHGKEIHHSGASSSKG